MATVNEDYTDLMIGHQIGIQRYGGGIVNDLIPILEQSKNAEERLLMQHIAAIEARGGIFDLQSEKQLEELMVAYRELVGQNFDEFEKRLVSEMETLMQYEMDYQQTALSKVIPFTVTYATVDPERTAEAIASLTYPNNLPVYQRKNLSGWIDSMEEAQARRTLSMIATGFATGQTSQQIVQNIMQAGSRLTRSHAETIVRTSTATMAQAARNNFFAANEDISKEDVWRSVLDGRTTLICFGRDGKVKPRGYWQKRYPAHMGERSTIIALIDGVGIIGTRPSVRDTRTRKKREIDFRQAAKEKVGINRWQKMTNEQRQGAIRRERNRWAKEVIGTSPNDVTMENWLKKQPVDFQKEYLGPTRYALFTKGGLKAGDFADINGDIYSLAELARRDRQAFINAGLDPNQF